MPFENFKAQNIYPIFMVPKPGIIKFTIIFSTKKEKERNLLLRLENPIFF
jgi:hypothetical protein